MWVSEEEAKAIRIQSTENKEEPKVKEESGFRSLLQK